MSGQPLITLDEDIMRANAGYWRAHATVPLWAVVKSDGYGWGAVRVARVLEHVVDGFCVVDTNEYHALRPHTRQTIRIFQEPPLSELPGILAQGGIPNITSLAALDVIADYAPRLERPVRIRLGLAPSLGWSGVAPDHIVRIAERAASIRRLEVETWTHLTGEPAEALERNAFDDFLTVLYEKGLRIIGHDVESSLPLARLPQATADAVRIGAGLFGAPRNDRSAIRCAIRVEAPIVHTEVYRQGMRAGYGRIPVPPKGFVTTLRIGYGDGFLKTLAARNDIVSIGMQFTIMAHEKPFADKTVTLIDAETNIGMLAAQAGISAHELIVSLGTASQAKKQMLQ